MGDFPQRDRSVPAVKLKCFSTPMKDCFLMDAANNDVVSFIVTSEWDQDPENWDMFNGLDCENMNNFPPRKRSVPALKKTCSSTPIKD